MHPPTGLYHQLITNILQKKLDKLPNETYFCGKELIDKTEVVKILANYLEGLLEIALRELIQNGKKVEDQIQFCNDLIVYIDKQVPIRYGDDIPQVRDQLLIGILSRIGRTDKQLEEELKKNLPKSGLISSSLFTGSQSDISLDSEIERDILTADRIRWVVSFIRWSGLRIFKDALRLFCERDGASFQVITTSYMGATQERALEFLQNLPNTEVKISYLTDIQRLHAKAYIFERNSGADTAYIGSSNLSHAAFTKGLEWNLRVTAKENPHILNKAKATFRHYWNSPDFENLTERGLEYFQTMLAREKDHARDNRLYQVYSIRPFQKDILDKLKAERVLHGRFRNLLVAATGTGKTVISAFDYQRFLRENGGTAKLLFVAHRLEILQQARATFRGVLGQAYHDFGNLWVGNNQPHGNNLDHLFISIQTFTARQETLLQRLPSDYYDYIVIDEAHHSQANTYRVIFDHFTPKVLLGLTATPERMDGLSLEPDFCGRIAAEIRLPDALRMGLLSPFQYFCITDDSVDLRKVRWQAGKYDIVELGTRLSNDRRIGLIVQAIQYYLTDPRSCRALCFCVNQEHARFMSRKLQEAGLAAQYLLGDDKVHQRADIKNKLKEGEINFLCVVDLFNEGLDIPEVDTVLFFRPTESLTVFLQQLGRGLRISTDKDFLTVLDFVNHPHQNYNFARKFRGLIGRTRQSIKDEIEGGFPHVPPGCTIRLEHQAREYILENIKNSIFNIDRLRSAIAHFHNETTKQLTIAHFLEFHDLDIGILYKGQRYWSRLKKDAGKLNFEENDVHQVLSKGLKRLIHIDSPAYLNFIDQLLGQSFGYSDDSESESFALMFYYDMWQEGIGKFGFNSIREGIQAIAKDEIIVNEIREIIDYLRNSLDHIVKEVNVGFPCVLELHAQYSRSQILCAFGLSTPERRAHSQEGVVPVPNHNAELLLVTLNKSEKDFSPTTLYEDYAISETIFHWQSQNRTSPDTPVGQSYIRQKEFGKSILLFTRDVKRDRYGATSPYVFLGPVDFQSSEGERPMSIHWELREPMPPGVWRAAAKAAV